MCCECKADTCIGVCCECKADTCIGVCCECKADTCIGVCCECKADTCIGVCCECKADTCIGVCCECKADTCIGVCCERKAVYSWLYIHDIIRCTIFTLALFFFSQIQKDHYLSYRRVFHGDNTDVFEKRRRAKQATGSSVVVTVGPTPFTNLSNPAAVAMASARSRTQPTAGMYSWKDSLLFIFLSLWKYRHAIWRAYMLESRCYCQKWILVRYMVGCYD